MSELCHFHVMRRPWAGKLDQPLTTAVATGSGKGATYMSLLRDTARGAGWVREDGAGTASGVGTRPTVLCGQRWASV